MRHRSGPVELCEKMLEMRHRSGPVELCEKMLELIKCTTCQEFRCGIMCKNARIYQMRHRSGPVELCEKMLEFIKCATGPDLWNYVKKC